MSEGEALLPCMLSGKRPVLSRLCVGQHLGKANSHNGLYIEAAFNSAEEARQAAEWFVNGGVEQEKGSSVLLIFACYGHAQALGRLSMQVTKENSISPNMVCQAIGLERC